MLPQAQGIVRQVPPAGAVLVTGHEVRTVLDAADDIAWLIAGTTHALGTPQAALAHDQFRREYLAWR